MSKIKALFPIWLKRIPWYLFKSPQRQEGVSYTWMVELRGLYSFLRKRAQAPFRGPMQGISICTGIRNRTDNYLNYVLPSILRMKYSELIEISIFDCGSEDSERLEAEIRRQWKGKLVFSREEVPFTRSYSFNQAIDQATQPIIFAADADLSYPRNLVSLCNRYVSPYSVWFPIYFNLKKDVPAVVSKANGEWLPVSKGMFASTKAQFEQAGKFDLKYKSWGLEDWDIWMRFFRAGFLPIRTRCKGLLHHWHPDVPDKIAFIQNKPEFP